MILLGTAKKQKKMASNINWIMPFIFLVCDDDFNSLTSTVLDISLSK